MDKTFLVEQLGTHLRASVQQAHRVSEEARADAKSGADRAVNLARGQGERSAAAREALDALEVFRPKPMGKRDPIALGSIVEVEDEQGGRTLFVAPVGGGLELTGPGGDGIFQVVTPSSPFGKAVIGKRVGAVVDVTVAGELAEWTITYVA